LALHEAGPVTLCSKQKSSPFWTIFSPAGALLAIQFPFR
jgi:hypothetical protein